MSSGGQNTTTQTVTSLPPEYVKPQMEFIANAARTNFDKGIGPKYFTGSTTIPFSTQTTQALGMAETAARNNPLQSNAFGLANEIMQNDGIAGGDQHTGWALGQLGGIASGGMNINTGNQYQNLMNSQAGSNVASGANPSLGVLGNIATGANKVNTGARFDALGNSVPDGGLAAGTAPAVTRMSNIARGVDTIRSQPAFSNVLGLGQLAEGTGTALGAMGDYASGQYGIGTEEDYRNELNRVGGQTAADQYLTGLASGANVGGNPFLKAEIENSNRQLADQINSRFSGSGRSFSGAHAGVLGDRLSRNANTALFNQYNQDVQNQLGATGMIDASRQALAGTRRGLLGDITGVQGQNVQNQLGAANMQFNALQGAQNDYAQRQLAGGQAQVNLENQNIQNRLSGANSLFGNLQNAQNQGFTQELAALQGRTGVDTNNLAAQTAASNNLANFYQGARNQGFTNQLSALQGLSGVQGANIANVGNTSQTMANIYQNAQDAALKTALASPALADTRFNDLSRLADIGAQYETKDAEKLKDQIARFEFENMRPWNQLGLLSGAVQGVNSGGTQNSVTQRPDMPLGQRLLGGGVAGGALGASIGGPIGGAAGAGLGALLGLF